MTDIIPQTLKIAIHKDAVMYANKEVANGANGFFNDQAADNSDTKAYIAGECVSTLMRISDSDIDRYESNEFDPSYTPLLCIVNPQGDKFMAILPVGQWTFADKALEVSCLSVRGNFRDYKSLKDSLSLFQGINPGYGIIYSPALLEIAFGKKNEEEVI